jgi:transcriptional regulator with XRE-family HTH domain
MTDQVYVGFPTASLDKLVEKVIGLPAPFSPQFFTRGERVSSKLDRVDDSERFSAFYNRARRSSFGMVGEKIFFEFQPNVFRDDARKPLNGYLLVTFKKGFSHSDKLADLLVQLLDVKGVSFGYVGQWEESSHRHRLKKTWGGSTAGAASTEMTIGVNFSKYVPGLYWKTAFSESYLSEHDLDVALISSLAIETNTYVSEAGIKFYIFKFYNDPKSWKDSIESLEEFCATNKQFFSMRRLQPNIDAATTEVELAEVIGPYS